MRHAQFLGISFCKALIERGYGLNAAKVTDFQDLLDVFSGLVLLRNAPSHHE